MSTSVSTSTSAPVGNTSQSCSGNHKTRLLIGEGNFSFALNLINKHDIKAGHTVEKSLGRSIIATELKKNHCSDCDTLKMLADLKISSTETDKSKQPIRCDKCTLTEERISALIAKGAVVKLGVDGTKIHEVEEFQHRTFSRIHWNCPHDGSNFHDQTLPGIVESFFQSCAKVQKCEDRVHITLAQPAGKKAFYQGYIYNIARATSLAGYKILKKRKFDSSRYPEYQHVQTIKNGKALVTDQGMREFVFQKVDTESFENASNASRNAKKRIPIIILTKKVTGYSEKKCTVQRQSFYRSPRTVFDCSSDEDSSDYESS
jgi:Domain of unknown function (DUF2431)